MSLKTQELYVVVFVTRYLDLFWNFLSLYNTVMKIVFLAVSIGTVYLMRFKYYHTYDKEHDTFRVAFLIAPAALLSLVFHYDVSPFELLWTFSIWLEAVAILPQLLLVQRTGEIETMNATYMAALGGYRACYIFNYLWRYAVESNYWNPLAWVAALLQTGLYSDFLYYYFVSKYYGKKLTLPS